MAKRSSSSTAASPEAASARSWEPLGRALLDYLSGDMDATATVLRRDGRRDTFPAAELFRVSGFPLAEELALELANGRVLDAGAGAGAHALVLEQREHEVVALDVSPLAVEVMRRRGLADVRLGGLLDLKGELFDTILLLMNGAGLGGTIEGFERILDHCRGLLTEGGSILVDGADLRNTNHPREREALDERVERGLYFGEVQMQLEYRGQLGETFHWLFLDQSTLRALAKERGWATHTLFEADDSAYLARLTPV